MNKFNFNLSKTSLPEILNILSLFLLNLKFLKHRAWNPPPGTELPKFFERNQVLREWDSSSRSLVRESVRCLFPLALWEHGCNAGLDNMVSISSSEENVLLLQYLNRFQVTPRGKSLNNPKVQKNSLNTKFLPGVYRVCVQVCVHVQYTQGWLCLTGLCTGIRVKPSQSAQQDVLQGMKEWKEISVQWVGNGRNWFLHTYPMCKYSKMVPAPVCAYRHFLSILLKQPCWLLNQNSIFPTIFTACQSINTCQVLLELTKPG